MMPRTDNIVSIQFSYTSVFLGGSTISTALRIRDLSDAIWRQYEGLCGKSVGVKVGELETLRKTIRRYCDRGAEIATVPPGRDEYVIADPHEVRNVLSELEFASTLAFFFRAGGTLLEPDGAVAGYHRVSIKQPFRMGFAGERIRHYAHA
jgi:hypothetical protein